MKEHLLTGFLALTTGITILIFSMINGQPVVPTFGQDAILFEHQTTQGQIVVRQNTYDQFALSFLTRSIAGQNYAGSSYSNTRDTTQLLTLVASSEIPFTTHAVVSSNSDLHQIIIMEAGFPIAHQAHAKRTTCADTTVFLVSSVDLTGKDVMVFGFDINGELIVEIAIP